MTRKDRSHRPVMNGAASRLLKLRVRNDSDMRMIDEVILGLEAVIATLNALKIIGLDMQAEAIRYATKTLQAVRDDLELSTIEIRGAEQYTRPDSWRMMAQYDKPFAKELLELIEIPILREAVMDLDGGRLAELRGIFCDEA